VNAPLHRARTQPDALASRLRSGVSPRGNIKRITLESRIATTTTRGRSARDNARLRRSVTSGRSAIDRSFDHAYLLARGPPLPFRLPPSPSLLSSSSPFHSTSRFCSPSGSVSLFFFPAPFLAGHARRSGRRFPRSINQPGRVSRRADDAARRW